MGITKIKLAGETVEISLPRFSFGDHGDNGFYLGASEDNTGGSVQHFDCGLLNGFRHISAAQFASLFAYTTSNDHRAKDILGQIMLAYLLERGINNDKKLGWTRGIYLSDGLALHGTQIAIAKDLDGKTEGIFEATYDTEIGQTMKAETEYRAFEMERIFRKEMMRTVSLKEIDKASADFTEYFFGVEFEDLPLQIQKSHFILPEDVVVGSRAQPASGGPLKQANIAPMMVDLSFFSTEKPGIRIDLSHLALDQVTFLPSRGCDVHVLVRGGKVSTSAQQRLANEKGPRQLLE